jgi:N-acetylglucosaminyldiphosphoundecaprenol N-acetyl-beta-D-mannosaminyltransferase
VSGSNTLVKLGTEYARANVLGAGIHAVDLTAATGLIEEAIAKRRKGYVCLTGVHGVMEAQRDSRFCAILDRALLVAPDGMPTVWVGRAQGFRQMRRVYGPDLMLEICRRSAKKRTSHFLYGGNPGVAEKLKSNLEAWCPGITIVGTYTPPFRPLSPDEQCEIEDRMARLCPDIVWVGMSTPKQERFMADNIERFSCSVMIGVGAAFDIYTGNLKDAPYWIKQAGLQWLHRLSQEPSRLWKRYLVNNPAFLWRIIVQLAGLRSYELQISQPQIRDTDEVLIK